MESEANNSGGTKRKSEGPPSTAAPVPKKVVVKTISSAPLLYNPSTQTKNEPPGMYLLIVFSFAASASYYVSPLFTESDRMNARQVYFHLNLSNSH